MVDWRVKRSPVGALAIVVLSLLLPACRAPGGPPPPWVRSPDTDSTNVTLRPILDGERRRTFFIGGYAGANYGPRALRPPRSCRHAGCSCSGSTGCDGRAGNAGPELSNRLTRASIHCGCQILCAILNRYARTRGHLTSGAISSVALASLSH